MGRAKVGTDKQKPLDNIRANFTALTTPQASQEGRRAIKTPQVKDGSGYDSEASRAAYRAFKKALTLKSDL
jgi:hypothetical protein